MAVRKLKPKSKVKARKAVKPKVKATKRLKSKAVVKTKPKSKPKTKLKTKPAKKAKAKLALVPLKKKKSDKTKSITPYSDKQKTEFLVTIEKLIKLHKSDKDGLKSLTQVERILDPFNQKYTDAHEKFNAIIEYGISEDPSVVRKHVFVPVKKDKEINEIYKLLVEISKGKMKHADVMLNITKMYQDSLKSRR